MNSGTEYQCRAIGLSLYYYYVAAGIVIVNYLCSRKYLLTAYVYFTRTTTKHCLVYSNSSDQLTYTQATWVRRYYIVAYRA